MAAHPKHPLLPSGHLELPDEAGPDKGTLAGWSWGLRNRQNELPKGLSTWRRQSDGGILEQRPSLPFTQTAFVASSGEHSPSGEHL